jgi:hypothetical protein
MSFQRKALLYSGIFGLLALLFVATMVFDPQRMASQSALYAWLPPAELASISKVEITPPRDTKNGEPVVLVKKDTLWFDQKDGRSYPVKQERVQDLLSALAKQAEYPVRATTDQAYTKLGVDGDHASRITLYGANQNTPVLDLFIGNRDAVGRAVYIRSAASKEVRSGLDRFSSYGSDTNRSWYDLRFFPSTGKGALTANQVQRIHVVLNGDILKKDDYILSRDDKDQWVITSDRTKKVDPQKAEAWVKSILEAEGEDFLSPQQESPLGTGAVITLELGDGSNRIITIGEALPDSKRKATLSTSPFGYAVAGWAVNQIVKSRDYFYASSPPSTGGTTPRAPKS